MAACPGWSVGGWHGWLAGCPARPSPHYYYYFHSFLMLMFLSVSFFITLATLISKSSCGQAGRRGGGGGGQGVSQVAWFVWAPPHAARACPPPPQLCTLPSAAAPTNRHPCPHPCTPHLHTMPHHATQHHTTHLRDVHAALPQRKHPRLCAHRLELRAAGPRHALPNLFEVDAALQGGQGGRVARQGGRRKRVGG